ncbi:MAG: hypothetical protein FJY42_04430 [Betaproteobacteria bacterium]|nr:hypothetical protein [Betaproteobacteria bacterium]
MHRLICGFKLLGLLGWLGLSGHLAAQSPTITRSSGEVLPIRLELRTLGRGEKAPTVIVGHGSGGLAAMHREMGSTLNSWGYNAVVIDHYSLRGIAVHTGKVVLGARGEDRALDFIETGRWIAQQPWHEGKIAVVGFSQGGGGVLTLVNDRNMRNLDYVSDAQPNPISVASAFYPSCFFSPPPAKPSIPTQVHLAEMDDLARVSYCGLGDDSPYRVHLYKGATHSFDESFSPFARLGFTQRYNPRATRESRENLKKFLDEHLR